MKIALLNSAFEGAYVVRGEDSLSLSSLRSSLPESHEISLYPKGEYSLLRIVSLIRELKAGLPGSDLIGISCNTFGYPLAKKLSSAARACCPGAAIVLGGSHFMSAGAISAALHERAGDAVISGKADAFCWLIGRMQESGSQGARALKMAVGAGPAGIPEGIYFKEGRKILAGTMKIESHDGRRPFSLQEKMGRTALSVLLSNSCGNCCSYCASPRKASKVDVEAYAREIKHDLGSRRISNIILYDNNPISEDNLAATGRFFESLRKELGYLPDTVLYGDPAALLDPAHRERILEFLESFDSPNSNIFFGKEASTGRVASMIGRKHLGKDRDTKMLRAETVEILRLASGQRTGIERKGLNFTIVVNYILSPFEDGKSISSLIDECNGFSRHRRVIVRSNLLWPMPGTELSGRYAGHFIPPENLPLMRYFPPDDVNYWDLGFMNSRFLELCFAMRARLYFNPYDPFFSWCSIAALKLAGELSTGAYDKNTAERIMTSVPPEYAGDLAKRMNALIGFIDGNRSRCPDEDFYPGLLEIALTAVQGAPQPIAGLMRKEYKKILLLKARHFRR